MLNNLQILLKKFIEEYESELNAARKDEDFKRPFGKLVRQDITSLITLQLPENIYKVKGSVGAGRWTDVPWIAVFDKRITTSAQRGVYIVYLLNKDTKELFLTLNQGATDVAQGGDSTGKLAFTGIASASNSKAAESLKNRAKNIRSEIGSFPGLGSNPIDTGSKAYDAGCIYYIKYTLDSLPEDEKLYSDLNKFIEAYKAYYDKVFLKSEENDVQVQEGEEELQIEQQIKKIFEYINSKGFVYDEKLLKNFYLSLKSKPFVLLAGTSGTGKTRLVRLFAEAIGAYGSGRYKQVAVKPDWSDSMDLFGHVNLDNKFVPGAIVEFIKKAADDPNKLPYILCLDEMNLARVEYYFSDFLSIMETRDWVEDEIVTDNLVPKICYSGDEDAEKLYSNLMIPENLYIIGTVNMDETTFPFSKKVLDRANTIEFSYVDFNLPESISTNEAKAIEVKNEFLRSDYLKLRIDCIDKWEVVKKYNEDITKINSVLEKSDSHFGYRMRDDIIFYMLHNDEFDLLPKKEAFDNQIMQKILPRIQGSSESTANILRELFKICAGSFTDKNGQTDGLKMKSYLDGNRMPDYPKSAEKICKMLRRYEDDDFTSFWI
jgi:hypothetical protein